MDEDAQPSIKSTNKKGNARQIVDGRLHRTFLNIEGNNSDMAARFICNEATPAPSV